MIVFDELTTVLDVTAQVDVLLSMRKAVEEFNTAAIYIIHDLALVAQMADVIKVLRYGEEVDEAKTPQMLGKEVSIGGESGSGESTTAWLVTGILPPAKGSVAYTGTDLTLVFPIGSPVSFLAVRNSVSALPARLLRTRRSSSAR